MQKGNTSVLASPNRGSHNRRTRMSMHKQVVNRVPDETINLEDSVCHLDTSLLLALLGIFKLILLIPLLILGILLISIETSNIDRTLKPTSVPNNLDLPAVDDVTSISKGLSAMGISKNLSGNSRPKHVHDERFNGSLRNDSLAPVWTAIFIAASAAMDFLTIFKRRGETIIVYMLVSTVTFVACILCIEYDRLEMQNIIHRRDLKRLELQYRLYLSVVIVASMGVAVGSLSVFIGTRLAALEEQRLFMERDGLDAILTKKDTKIPRLLMNIARHLNCVKPIEDFDAYDDDDMTNTDSVAERSDRRGSWEAASTSPPLDTKGSDTDKTSAELNHIKTV